ncbi:DUF2829 domain-containing protein [Enterococcus sp. BWR-S5]|nr:MW1434 family type I TA system toxin [Enterococcus sp. BWR-S5]MBL1225385.1 DUF2829 domain-containing protein [Enterococcus sp. BWR-S5]
MLSLLTEPRTPLSDVSQARTKERGNHYEFWTVTDALAIKTTSNQIQVGWLASQSDMLAEDWETLS